MSKKCIIFDMDATLIDSSFAICKTLNFFRKEMFDLDPLDEDTIIRIINNPNLNAFEELYGSKNIVNDKNIKIAFDSEFGKNYALSAKAYKEALEVLKKCKNLDYKLAVATNAPHETIENILDNCNILSYFDMVIGSDLNTPQKPDPTMLKLICSKFNLKSIFIGDSKKDFLAAKNANIDYINVIWGRNELIDGVPNCQNAKEVLKLLLH